MPTIRRLTLAGLPGRHARNPSIPTSESESRRASIFTSGWQEFGDEGIAPDYIPEGEAPRTERSRTMTLLGGRLKLRPQEDNDDTDWWFASTAIPLIVATFAPMANMLSIAALVVYWRNKITTDDPATKYSTSLPGSVKDPQWALDLNGASLACGFVGNAFLLCNFTRKIRYIIALPVSIFFFYIASALLIGITVAMNAYVPPGPDEVYSQGFWYAIIAACLYMFCGMLQMVNMLGYFLGHYPQHFDLTDEQRNLILQTMIFFIWLSGGAGVFTSIEPDWGYPDALYFCDVTLLTIGFGDFYATNDVGRGLVFPFSVGGTIILGLMVSSIHKFAGELSKEKVVRKHIETRRVDTLSRVATLQRRLSSATNATAPMSVADRQTSLDEKGLERSITFQTPLPPLRKVNTLTRVTSYLVPSRSQKAIMMHTQRDRFNKMREIQYAAKTFKKWYALTMSIISFGLLWCVGAMVFYYVEHETQGLTYFQSLYFCYVSLLTIGYGDLSPKSNAGKPFFVLWSLIAVPTMTILISDLGDTAISGFKRKVLDYGGLAFLGKGQGWGLDWFVKKKESMVRRLSVVGITLDASPQLENGSGDDNDTETRVIPRTIDELLEEDMSRPEMLKRLAYALRTVSNDLKEAHRKRYTYEEWVEFIRLIRFTKLDGAGQARDGTRLEYDEAVDGIVEWDWLDSNSPMTSEQSEAEWVMDRLLESLLRTFKRADVADELARIGRPKPRRVSEKDDDYADSEEYSDESKQHGNRVETDASAKHKRRPKRIKAHARPHGVRFHKHQHKTPSRPKSISSKDSGIASGDSSPTKEPSKVLRQDSISSKNSGKADE